LEPFATKADLRSAISGVRTELRKDIAGLGRDFAARLLESEGRTRVLLEDVIARAGDQARRDAAGELAYRTFVSTHRPFEHLTKRDGSSRIAATPPSDVW
jgi:hypothetical protein